MVKRPKAPGFIRKVLGIDVPFCRFSCRVLLVRPAPFVDPGPPESGPGTVQSNQRTRALEVAYFFTFTVTVELAVAWAQSLVPAAVAVTVSL